MRKPILLAVLSVLITAPLSQAASYDLAFSTYFGGSDWDQARDVCADAEGNTYVVGGTASSNFPTTAGAFQRTQNKTGTQVGSGGYCDAYVVKLAPDGALLWSTYLGGPNYDRAYGVEVDDDGNVYVAGRAGPGFPVTAGAFQTTFQGASQGIYGQQNGFIAKFDPEGTLLWASYAGVGYMCRDVAVDAEGNACVQLSYRGTGPLPPAAWFTNAYRATPIGAEDLGVMKVHTDGAAVLWATWFGGSAKEGNECGVRVDGEGNVYLNFTTWSSNVPTTPGAYDRTYNGGSDAFIAKFSPDGSQLLYGTYFGGPGDDGGVSTHNLAVDADGNAYLAIGTQTAGLPTTAGALQAASAGGTDLIVVRFSPTGALERCTYVGGSGGEETDGVYADDAGNVVVTGTTASADFPVTADTAFQAVRSAQNDAYVLVLAADFSSVLYATYLGGPAYEAARSGFLDAQGNLYLAGSTNATGWPTLNACQPTFGGGGGGQELCYKGACYAGDVIVARLNRITPPLPGDADDDGDVDIDDFIILKSTFGRSPLVDDRADFDADGDVDIDDFIILKSNFGRRPGA